MQKGLGAFVSEKIPPVWVQTIQTLLKWKMSPTATQSPRPHYNSRDKILSEWKGLECGMELSPKLKILLVFAKIGKTRSQLKNGKQNL